MILFVSHAPSRIVCSAGAVWVSHVQYHVYLARWRDEDERQSLCLPVWVFRLQAACVLLISGVDTDVGLLTCKSNGTLLGARHAARVGQASPHEDP